MIKGIFLDVDGVLVGNKKGYNWPEPNKKVIDSLKMLRERGIIVSLCTGKGTFAIKDIALKAKLDNLHIGDGGAIIKNFITDEVLKIDAINKDIVLKIYNELKAANIYIELYSEDKYSIESKNANDVLRIKHADILYRQPSVVASLKEVINVDPIVKIMPIPKNPEEKKLVIDIFNKFSNMLSLQWGTHLTALPTEFGVITNLGISKKESIKKISSIYNLSLIEALGVGDGETDWGFMSLCGYKGIMGNASPQLINMIDSTDKNSFVGKSVNENGLLTIFEYFKLID